MIDRQRPPGEDDRLGSAFFGKAMELRQCVQIEVISREVRGRLAAGALDLAKLINAELAFADLDLKCNNSGFRLSRKRHASPDSVLGLL